MILRTGVSGLSALFFALFPLESDGQEPDSIASVESLPFRVTEDRLRCTEHDILRRPFFGDTHVHTALSFDAWGQGTLAGPGDAYRYARGEVIGTQPYDEEGRPMDHLQLRRPLDYAVVTDHSDLLGETQRDILDLPQAPITGGESIVEIPLHAGVRRRRRVESVSAAVIGGDEGRQPVAAYRLIDRAEDGLPYVVDP